MSEKRIMNKGKEEIAEELADMLHELLRYGNQEGSFKVTGINLETMKFNVEFNIHVVEEDNYIGFAGY